MEKTDIQKPIFSQLLSLAEVLILVNNINSFIKNPNYLNKYYNKMLVYIINIHHMDNGYGTL